MRHIQPVEGLFSDEAKVKRLVPGVFLFSMDEGEQLNRARLLKLSAENQNSPILIKKADKFFIFGFKDKKWDKTELPIEDGTSFENLPFSSEGQLLQAADSHLDIIRQQLIDAHPPLEILKIPSISKPDEAKYFVFQRIPSEKLGEGNYSKVYKAYPLKNPDEPFTEENLDRLNFSVVKIPKRKKKIESILEESRITNRFYAGHELVVEGEESFFVMPYLKGDMFDEFIKKKRGRDYYLRKLGSLPATGPKPNRLYLSYVNNELRYTVLDPIHGEIISTIKDTDLVNMELNKKSAFLQAWQEMDIKKLKSFLEDILDITSRKGHTKPDKLSLLDALNLAKNFSHIIVDFHHKRASGEAIIHGDIKEDNIIVEVQDDSQESLPHVFDFGFSVTLKEENKRVKFEDVPEGSTYSTPPEVAHGFRQTGSDIYSCLPFLLKLFGVREPRESKFKIHKLFLFGDYESSVDVITPFSFDGLLDNFSEFQKEGLLTKCPIDVKYAVKTFLQRMGLYEASLRPDSDELLRFFTSFRLLLLVKRKQVETNTSDYMEEEKHYCAELAMLASGVWNKFSATEDQDRILNCFRHGVLSKFTLAAFNLKQEINFDAPIPRDAKLAIEEHRRCQIRFSLTPEESIKSSKRCQKIEVDWMARGFLKHDARATFVYCLLADLEVVKESFLPNLEDRDCISLHRYMVRHRAGIIIEHGVGKFSNLLDAVSDRLLKKVNEYTEKKKLIQAQYGLDYYETFFGRLFGYKVSEKCDATTILRDSIKNGHAATFFAPGSRAAKLRRAARQGELGRCSSELVDYISNDLRRISIS